MKKYLLNRVFEPSTWAGIGVIVQTAIFTEGPILARVGVAAAGLVAMLFK